MRIIKGSNFEHGRSSYKGTHPNKDRARDWELTQLLKFSPRKSKILVLASREGQDIKWLINNGVESSRIVGAEIYNQDFEEVQKRFSGTNVTLFRGNVVDLPKKLGMFGAIYLDVCGVPSRRTQKLIRFSQERLLKTGVFAISTQVANRAKSSCPLSRTIQNADLFLKSFSGRGSFSKDRHFYVLRLFLGIQRYIDSLSWVYGVPEEPTKLRFSPLFGRYYDGSTTYALVGGRFLEAPRLSSKQKNAWDRVVGGNPYTLSSDKYSDLWTKIGKKLCASTQKDCVICTDILTNLEELTKNSCLDFKRLLDNIAIFSYQSDFLPKAA